MDDVDDSAAFDFGDTDNGVEDDFTSGTVDEAPEVDGTGGYDYNSNTSSSFDDTFVDQPSAESIAAADAWSPTLALKSSVASVASPSRSPVTVSCVPSSKKNTAVRIKSSTRSTSLGTLNLIQ